MSNEPGIASASASGYQFSKTDLRVEGNAKVEQLEEGISYGCLLGLEFLPTLLQTRLLQDFSYERKYKKLNVTTTPSILNVISEQRG
jgi:hypothetical protein